MATPASETLRAQLSAYRHLSRGVAPPNAVAQRCFGTPLAPPISGEALLEAEAAADQQLLEALDTRQAELRDAPSELPAPLRLPLAVERTLPAVLPMQRALRSEIVGFCDRSRLLDDAMTSLAMQRPRRTRQQREIRDSERAERKRAAENVRAAFPPPRPAHRRGLRLAPHFPHPCLPRVRRTPCASVGARSSSAR